MFSKGKQMKILHTSDWHLGSRLHNWDGTEEELHFFAQLAATVEKEQPDALVVSGDIFDTGAPGNDVAKRFTDALLDVTARCPDMTTVVIAGNHDSYSRLVVDKELWRRARVHVFGMPAEDADGKAVFEKNVVVLPGKGVIAAVPFCHPRNFPTVDGAAGDNREKNYFEGLAKYVADHSAGLPTVLMAHLAVKGDLDFRGHDKFLVIGGEECVDVESLGEGYGYVALGHIHCPQWVKGGTKVARYCGTPRPIHFETRSPQSAGRTACRSKTRSRRWPSRRCRPARTSGSTCASASASCRGRTGRSARGRIVPRRGSGSA